MQAYLFITDARLSPCDTVRRHGADGAGRAARLPGARRAARLPGELPGELPGDSDPSDPPPVTADPASPSRDDTAAMIRILVNKRMKELSSLYSALR